MGAEIQVVAVVVDKFEWKKRFHFSDPISFSLLVQCSGFAGMGHSMLRPYKVSELIFALEDEIRKCGESAGVFRVAMAIEAGLGAMRVVLSEAARAVERA